MRVAIVGAGALGSVYGARLAASGCAVDVVGRSAGPARAIVLERVTDGDVLRWNTGAIVERPPDAAELVFVAVPYPALDAAFARLEGGGGAPVVVLTPMLPRDHARLSAQVPGRLLAAMPAVVAYRNAGGVVRYWLPRGATTLVAARSPAGPEAEAVRRLAHAGMPARIERDVLARNVATTVSFMPLAMGLDLAGSIDAALHDEPLLALALEATAEGCDLGRAVGKAEAWAALLLRFVGPFTLRAGVGLARVRAPEAVAYVEEHFGRKLHAQNVLLGEGMIALAHEKGVRRAALERLVDRLKRG